MFFISKFVTHGITSIIKIGNITIILGKKEFRLICLNSFSIKYFSIAIAYLLCSITKGRLGYSNLFLNFDKLKVRKNRAINIKMTISFPTISILTPIIISLRQAEINQDAGIK